MQLRPANVFSSNMVLQQKVPVPVWGTAAPEAEVKCHLFQGCEAVAQANAQGNWYLILPAQDAGGPYTMTLTSGEETLTYSDVYLGEVWLAGGQSNMEMALINTAQGDQVAAAAKDPRIHFYETPKVTTPKAADEANACWNVATSENAGWMSAVGYYAAREMAEALDVHIGILECFWGGSYAHCWMPRELLAQFPEGQARMKWYDDQVGDKTDEQYDQECAEYQALVDDWNKKHNDRRAIEPDVSMEVIERDYGPYPWPPPVGRTNFLAPANLYDCMISRIMPYAVRGFWYYQGEANEMWPQDYVAELSQLIRCWRRSWNNDTLPFFILQLPMYGTNEGEERWPLVRRAQSQAALQEPHSGLVVLADTGEADNIHPVVKEPVGHRLALLTLDVIYGQNVTGRSPRLLYALAEGSQVSLRFTHEAGGMYLTEGESGLEIAGEDGVFHPAAASAQGDTVTVSSEAVPSPAVVRYAWHNYGPAKLYGGTGLAAEPFEFKLS